MNNSETVQVSAVTTTTAVPEASPEAVVEPATEDSTAPVAGVATEPSTEATAEPVTEATAESATEATGEPATEAVGEPATEAIGEPATEAAVEPATEAVSADTTPPVITLNGADTISISVGAIYKDSGATAVDDVDGDITQRIRITSTLDNVQPGTYAVGYNVTDSAGNDAVAVYRFITVK